MEINQNITECIKTFTNIGSTTYVNICTGVAPLNRFDVFRHRYLIFLLVALIGTIIFGVYTARKESRY